MSNCLSCCFLNDLCSAQNHHVLKKIKHQNTEAVHSQNAVSLWRLLLCLCCRHLADALSDAEQVGVQHLAQRLLSRTHGCGQTRCKSLWIRNPSTGVFHTWLCLVFCLFTFPVQRRYQLGCITQTGRFWDMNSGERSY